MEQFKRRIEAKNANTLTSFEGAHLTLVLDTSLKPKFNNFVISYIFHFLFQSFVTVRVCSSF